MNPLLHLDLLSRFDRTFNLPGLIRDRVHQGARVLDAGCGLGILSYWAAQAGAGAVDAVDLSDTALAHRLAVANGVADRVTFHEMDLREFMLDPERAGAYDCLIAMLYLNDPRRDEFAARLTLDLKQRLLRPGGRILPEKVRYAAALAEWPDQNRFHAEQLLHDRVNEISRRYGMDFTPLHEDLLSETYSNYFPARRPDGRLVGDGLRFLGQADDVFEIDYVDESIDYPDHLVLRADRSGRADVVIWWQYLEADDRLIFTNQTVGWIDNAVTVQAGDDVRVRLDDTWRRTNVLTVG